MAESGKAQREQQAGGAGEQVVGSAGCNADTSVLIIAARSPLCYRRPAQLEPPPPGRSPEDHSMDRRITLILSLLLLAPLPAWAASTLVVSSTGGQPNAGVR